MYGVRGQKFIRKKMEVKKIYRKWWRENKENKEKYIKRVKRKETKGGNKKR